MAAPVDDRSFSGVPGEDVREQPYCPQQLQRLAVADHVAAGGARFIGLPAISQGEQTPYGVAVRAAESISDSRRGQNLGVCNTPSGRPHFRVITPRYGWVYPFACSKWCSDTTSLRILFLV